MKENKDRPNLTKGVISGVDIKLTEQEILEEAQASKAVRIYKKLNGVKTATSSVILFFDNPEIPDKIYIGWRSYKVREYIASPLRCYVCSRFGHKAISCKSVKPRCPRCSEAHEVKDCKVSQEQLKCANCMGNHATYDKECPRYKEAKVVANIAQKGKMTYAEAARQFKTTPQPEISKLLPSSMCDQLKEAYSTRPTKKKIVLTSFQSAERKEAPKVNSTQNSANQSATDPISTLQNSSSNEQIYRNCSKPEKENVITKNELVKMLTKYHLHIINVVKDYAPEHIRAGMVSDLVCGTYKYFGVNIEDLCPSFMEPGEIPSPGSIPNFAPAGN